MEMTDKKMTDKKMTDKKMTDKKMTDKKMTDKKMTDKKMTDNKKATLPKNKPKNNKLEYGDDILAECDLNIMEELANYEYQNICKAVNNGLSDSSRDLLNRAYGIDGKTKNVWY